jgi:hypothetical protein
MTMTEPDPRTPLDPDFIDRLVDAALAPAQLRAAIERLDREPDGWKRCALAFLEAQCWREAFRALDEPVPTPLGIASRPWPPATGRAVPRNGRWRRGVRAAALAAAAFALGWLVHAPRSSSPAGPAAPPPVLAVASGQDNPEPPPGTPGVVGPPRPTVALARRPRDDRSPPYPSEGVVAVARLRIGPEGDSAEVPLLAGPGIDAEWLRDQPPPLTEHGQALWRRRGYEVDQRRRIITATLDDGRLVTVPIDQVEFRYTGNNPL